MTAVGCQDTPGGFSCLFTFRICDDDNLCTDDNCDPASGCVNTPLPVGTSCSDGQFCNGSEACDAAGDCQPGTDPCDDGVACTRDACDEASDTCSHTPNNGECDDGQFCNGSETCDAVNGCQPGTAPNCADGVDCTRDDCDEGNDTCTHTPDDTACDDGDRCTRDTCEPQTGACVNTVICEIDSFPNSLGQIDVRFPADSPTPHLVGLSGPTTVEVNLEAIADRDANGREEVLTEMIQLELSGDSTAFGPIVLRRRDPSVHPFERTRGEIEETVDLIPGTLDIPPLNPAGVSAHSFFNIFFEVEIVDLGLVLHNHKPKHLSGTIYHKPPATGDTYLNPELIPLYDENDDLVAMAGPGFHIPNPPTRPPEIDIFPNSSALVDIRFPIGNPEPHLVSLSGPTSVSVDLAGLADPNGNGLEQVPTEMLQLSLEGMSQDFVQIKLRLRDSALDPFRRTLGGIEESANLMFGTLDLPPFNPNGPPATSFFDVFFEVEVQLPGLGGLLLHNHDPKHMSGLIRYKPPAGGDWYQNPELIPLYDANDEPVAAIGPGHHVPDPCQSDSQCNDNNPCTDDTCDRATGRCIYTNNTNPCNDGLFCTVDDVCGGGVCRGTARDCSHLNDECNLGMCNETAEACEARPANEGGPCNDGLFCTVGETCAPGVCGGGVARDCSALSDQCNLGVCNETMDLCEAQPANEGRDCNDGRFCTVGETCRVGACGGGQPRPVGTSCGDNHACPDRGICDDSGACVCECVAALQIETTPKSSCGETIVRVNYKSGCDLRGFDFTLVDLPDVLMLPDQPPSACRAAIPDFDCTVGSAGPGGERARAIILNTRSLNRIPASSQFMRLAEISFVGTRDCVDCATRTVLATTNSTAADASSNPVTVTDAGESTLLPCSCVAKGDVDCDGSFCTLFDLIDTVDQALGVHDPTCEADVVGAECDGGVNLFDLGCLLDCAFGVETPCGDRNFCVGGTLPSGCANNGVTAGGGSTLERPTRPSGDLDLQGSAAVRPEGRTQPSGDQGLQGSVAVRVAGARLRGGRARTADVSVENATHGIRGLSFTFEVPAGWVATGVDSLGIPGTFQPYFHQDEQELRVIVLSIEGDVIPAGSGPTIRVHLNRETPESQRGDRYLKLVSAEAADEYGRPFTLDLTIDPSSNVKKPTRQRPSRPLRP